MKSIIFRGKYIQYSSLMMKYFVFNKHDYLVLLCTVCPFMLIVCYLVMGDSYSTWPGGLYATLVVLVIGIFSWITHIVAANIMIDLIPSHSKIVYRISIQLAIYVVLTQL